MKFWAKGLGINSPLTVEERIALVNSRLDARLADAGFHRLGDDADWRRERSSTLQDRLVVSYGRKYAPANVSCSPIISVYSPPLVEEVRKRYGAMFAMNNFGARNIGFFMPSMTFLSWDCGIEHGPEQVANEIADAFLRHCIPEIEKITSLDDLSSLIERQVLDKDPHNRVMSSIAPTCLSFLRGRKDECRHRLMEMLSLLDQLGDNDKWAAKHLPKRARIENFISSLS